MARPSTDSQALLVQLPASFTRAQARELGVTDYALDRLMREALLDRPARGIFQRLDELETHPELAAIALRAPEATLCLLSALAEHDLTDEIPAQIDLALPQGTRQPTTDLPISWHAFQSETFTLGRQAHSSGVFLYDAERSVLDALRLRGTLGHATAYEALRRWLRRRGAQPSRLLAMAQQLPRAEGPLRAALEILL
jgi:hypothetical protein